MHTSHNTGFVPSLVPRLAFSLCPSSRRHCSNGPSGGLKPARCQLLRRLGRPLTVLVLALCFASAASSADTPPVARVLQEVNHERVELRGGFWGPRLKTHHEVTIGHALNCLEKDGHVTNFDKAAGVFDGPLRGHHAFDSDLHKALEGALYSLQHRDDSQLRKRRGGHPRSHPGRSTGGRLPDLVFYRQWA